MNLKKLIEDHEGFVSHAYQDPLGYWTIGIGRMVDEKRGGGITKEEAYYLLENDLKEVREGLDREIPWWKDLSEVRQAALIDMAFNMGVEGLMGFRNMLKYLKEGDYEKAAVASQNSLWARQVGRRAKHIEKMIRDDQLPD